MKGAHEPPACLAQTLLGAGRCVGCSAPGPHGTKFNGTKNYGSKILSPRIETQGAAHGRSAGVEGECVRVHFSTCAGMLVPGVPVRDNCMYGKAVAGYERCGVRWQRQAVWVRGHRCVP